MDHAPRRPRRCDRKHVYFNPEIQIRIMHRHTIKRSDLWVSSEDLKQTREDFHGILDCLTLDSSLYEEGGYFLLGLDSRKDQKDKYRNMLDSRYAVLKEQRKHNANSRWHSGVGSSDIEECISKSYQEHTSDAAKIARYSAVRLEEELNVKEEEKPRAQIMSLEEVQALLKRTSSEYRVSNGTSSAGSFHDTMDILSKDVQSSAGGSSFDDWSVDYSTDHEEEDAFGYQTIEVPVPEGCACLGNRNKSQNKLPEQAQKEEIRSTAVQSDWSVDISTDNDDDFLAPVEPLAIETSSQTASIGSLAKKGASLQGREIIVPAIIMPAHQLVAKNAIAA